MSTIFQYTVVLFDIIMQQQVAVEHTVFKDKTQEKHKFILGQKVGIQFPGNLTIIR